MTDGRHYNPRSDRQAKDERATDVKATPLLHNALKAWPPAALKATDPADEFRCGALAQSTFAILAVNWPGAGYAPGLS